MWSKRAFNQKPQGWRVEVEKGERIRIRSARTKAYLGRTASAGRRGRGGIVGIYRRQFLGTFTNTELARYSESTQYPLDLQLVDVGPLLVALGM